MARIFALRRNVGPSPTSWGHDPGRSTRRCRGPAETIASKTLKTSSFGSQPLIQNALAPDGTATVLFVMPTDSPPPAPTFALMASDGS
jgi:hypothetical protein